MDGDPVLEDSVAEADVGAAVVTAVALVGAIKVSEEEIRLMRIKFLSEVAN